MKTCQTTQSSFGHATSGGLEIRFGSVVITLKWRLPQWPGREHYGATEMDLRELAVQRGGGTPELVFRWLTEGEFVTFSKKPV